VSLPVVVDARGERCPVPVVMAARATRGLPDGAVVLLYADDPAAAVDVRAWAWLRGHAVDASEDDGFTVYTVRVGEGSDDDDGGGSDRST
jgi:tRNA 2-thiouridine synthesizing protein A